MLNVRLPVGELETAAAFSQTGDIRGTAALISYVYSGRLVSGGGSLRIMSPRYATVSLSPGATHTLSDASIFASVPIVKRATLTVQHSRVTMSDSPVGFRTSVQATTQVFSRADLLLTAARLRDERGHGFEVFAGMTVRLGGRATSTVSSDRGRDGVRTAVDLQQPLPVNSGLGYQVRSETTTSGAPSALSGVLQYQSRYGRYEVRREMVGTTARSNVTIAGGVVAIGGGVYATRPVRGSYALVRVPGVKNVRGFWSNQEVGKTDGGGNLFVPDLLPYFANQLKIADSDVPLDYEIGKADMTLAPPYRGGALAVFPVQQIRRISGTLQILDGTRRVPATYGEISVSVDGKEAHSPIGADGRFYFENLANGRYAAIVKYTGGRCMFTLSIPKSDEPVIDLGAVQCRLAEDR
jgi:outer membrane usher protein